MKEGKAIYVIYDSDNKYIGIVILLRTPEN